MLPKSFQNINISSSYAFCVFLYISKHAFLTWSEWREQHQPCCYAEPCGNPDWKGLLHLFNTLRISHNSSPFSAQRPHSSAIDHNGPCFGLPARVRACLMSLASSWGPGRTLTSHKLGVAYLEWRAKPWKGQHAQPPKEGEEREVSQPC